MSLFRIADSPVVALPNKKKLTGGMQVLTKGRVAIGRELPAIEPDRHYHLVTDGAWSRHDLMEHLLGFTGPAHVLLATWTMTEEPARKIMLMLDAGEILSLRCLLDKRMQVRMPKVLAYVAHNVDVRLTINHAKVTVLWNDTWQVAVVGSANCTTNPRIEAEVVAVCRDAAEFHKKWITDKLDTLDAYGKSTH